MTKTIPPKTKGILLGIVLVLVVGVVYLVTKDMFVLLSLLGVYLSVGISLLFIHIERLSKLEEHLEIAANINHSPLTSRFYKNTLSHLNNAEQFKDKVYKDLFDQALDDFNMKLSRLATGVCEFRAEAWRRPWRQLLSQKDVTSYYSTALVKSRNYWQDKPGKRSIEFNKAVASRLKTKRIFIIWDEVWDDVDIKRWIQDQQDNGIEVAVVRQTEIPTEEDLFHDFGIYGNRAVGYQFLDNDCSTMKFELHFDREMYEKTVNRFKNLELYANAESTRQYLAQRQEQIAQV